MSDDELERIKQRKAEQILKIQSLPKEIVHIYTIEEFDRLIKIFPENVVIVDLWAEWCAPCLAFAPVFEKLQQEYSTEFIFVKVNVDQNIQVAQRYRITAIPTTLFLKNGNILKKFVGTMNYGTMKNIIENIKS